jgi:UDP-N-acetyl-D-mannosaminuronic acid dehydrogenase
MKLRIEKIGVIGPGIVGMPMAAMLAKAAMNQGILMDARVIVIQRNSKTSGWKVESINNGKSVIGGIEPTLDQIVSQTVSLGFLSASYAYTDIADADLILICVQTDKKGFEPDYEPMFEALTGLAEVLKKKPPEKTPLIVFESTLAPSSMLTLIRNHFSSFGLIEGQDILLGNSPNRVMPGRLVERIVTSDKLIGGITPGTSDRIKDIYSSIVTEGKLFTTNSMTAEVVKTLENAYRDVRIAFSTELVRYCDHENIDFYQVRDRVNLKLSQSDHATTDPNSVPTGGLLIPTIGVGGHCLPKDGILLWWRSIQRGEVTSKSMILNARIINDQSPAYTLQLFEKNYGNQQGKTVGLLGTAYRFNSEDTRNSPTLQLARLLLEKGYLVIMHDPHVKSDDQNLLKYRLEDYFSNDFQEVTRRSDYLIVCTAHTHYLDHLDLILDSGINGILDGCNCFASSDFQDATFSYFGIGKGTFSPTGEFIEFIYESFNIMEKGVGSEVYEICNFLNQNFAFDSYNQVDFKVVQELAASCSTGCLIADPQKVEKVPAYSGFQFGMLMSAV